MKALFTSYYGNRALPKDALLVQASNTAPKWWEPNPARRGAALELAPVWMKLAWAGKVELEDPAWVQHYTRQLAKLHASGRLAQIVDQLPDGAVLLCHEKDWNVCHRKVLAEFLTSHGYANVTEFVGKPVAAEEEKPQAVQLELFGGMLK